MELAPHQLQQVHRVLSPGWFLRNTEKNKISKLVAVCIFCVAKKTYQCWTSIHRNTTYEITFSQLLGLHFALMFALPMMQLFFCLLSPVATMSHFPYMSSPKGKRPCGNRTKKTEQKKIRDFSKGPFDVQV